MPDKDIDKIPITVEVPKADVWVRNDYRDRLRAALYRTGRAQFETRCDTCKHCTAATGGKQHGRYCEAHRAEATVTIKPCPSSRAHSAEESAPPSVLCK